MPILTSVPASSWLSNSNPSEKLPPPPVRTINVIQTSTSRKPIIISEEVRVTTAKPNAVRRIQATVIEP